MLLEEIKKSALISPWSPMINKAVYHCSIYFVAQIIKEDGEKEMTAYMKKIEVLFPNQYNNIDLEPVILEEAEKFKKEIDSGAIKIYSMSDPEREPRIEKFKEIKLMTKIPDAYKDSLRLYYAT